ncbi:MAG: nodulation efficiency protein D (NfeD) [Bacteroidales bacterium]|nr:nodulation efficiency protein D (NfeD) [Bacteroidales bacterium]
MWWIVVSLIVLGIILMLVEMLLIPGVGVAGFLSLGSLVAACWYAFADISPAAGWWTLLVSVVVLAVLLFFALRAKTWKRFELRTEVTSRVGTEAEKVHVGDRGIAFTRLAPLGTGRFGTVSCEVKSHDNTMVAAGTPVEVVAIEENKPVVKPVNQE